MFITISTQTCWVLPRFFILCHSLHTHIGLLGLIYYFTGHILFFLTVCGHKETPDVFCPVCLILLIKSHTEISAFFFQWCVIPSSSPVEDEKCHGLKMLLTSLCPSKSQTIPVKPLLRSVSNFAFCGSNAGGQQGCEALSSGYGRLPCGNRLNVFEFFL